MIYMKKIRFFFLIFLFFNSTVFANDDIDFEKWKISFKQRALANNISEKTFDLVMTDTKFLKNVIKYDRYQPEFYEDTKTYISKRSSTTKKKVLRSRKHKRKLFTVNARHICIDHA